MAYYDPVHTPACDPSVVWTTINASEALPGIVTDVGGPLSHGAIRELGIPCVIGTLSGTKQIRTGDRVSVDGSTGHLEVAGT